MPDAVLELDDPVAATQSVSGGKGATLAALRSLDLPVPNGVVVTTAAYRTLVDDPTIEGLRADLDRAVSAGDETAQSGVAADLRERIRDRPLPPEVGDGLQRHLDDGPYAVRSSATTEDLPGTSFTGQYDSFVGVEGHGAIESAVRDCMASLFTDRAVAYRARNDVPTEAAAMAVVVQRFIEPDASGILFTADPVTGRRSVSVLDAGPGRGEAQVSGRTTADAVRVADDGTVLDYRVGPTRSHPVLSDADARALATIGRRIEDALGAPQDVEWAIRDGDVAILQSRPITSLFPLPEPGPADDRPHVYYSFGHRQGMPEAMPPLVLDVWTDLVGRVGEAFRFPTRFVTTAGHRLYMDMTPYLSTPRLRERLLTNFEVVDQPGARALRTLLSDRPDDFPTTGLSPSTLSRYGSGLRYVWTVGRRLLGGVPGAIAERDPLSAPRRLRATYDEACEEAIDRIRAHETVAERHAAAVDELAASIDWLLDPFYGRFLSAVLAGALLRRLLPDERERVDALALGIEGDVVYDMTMKLGDVADVARETPALAAALRDGASFADVADRDDAGPFRDAFEGFLDEYGFRGVGEIDWSRPRYREDPTPLLNVVASHLETTESGGHRRRAEASRERAEEARAALVDAAPPGIGPLVGRLATTYRGYIGIREHPKYALSRLLAELRRQTLDAGAELAAAGALDDPEDVWFLRSDELGSALADRRTLAGVDVSERRTAFERSARLVAPRVLTSDGETPRPGPPPSATDSVHGTGAAPGVAEGVVRVVTDPTTARLAPGEVLVAPYTDPGWTPLFLHAGAVVTEVGGRLTHGSLVAREYGIPAVVAVEDATTRLRTGDRVRVDGTNGVVERLIESDTDTPEA